MAGELTITIDEQGNPTVAVKGVAGKSCKDITASIEKALGKVTETKKTGEFAQQESRRTQTQ